jgi:hypothetical protein
MSDPVEALAKRGFVNFAVNFSGEFENPDQEGHKGDKKND